MRFSGTTPEGQISVVVTEIEGDRITLDGNHPLAGKTLHFEVTVDSVREATDEELHHGHVHGPGCQHH
jgi:FKBP-type peptidyl-prolyl cis-trans isomerase SlyD